MEQHIQKRAEAVLDAVGYKQGLTGLSDEVIRRLAELSHTGEALKAYDKRSVGKFVSHMENQIGLAYSPEKLTEIINGRTGYLGVYERVVAVVKDAQTALHRGDPNLIAAVRDDLATGHALYTSNRGEARTILELAGGDINPLSLNLHHSIEAAKEIGPGLRGGAVRALLSRVAKAIPVVGVGIAGAISVAEIAEAKEAYDRGELTDKQFAAVTGGGAVATAGATMPFIGGELAAEVARAGQAEVGVPKEYRTGTVRTALVEVIESNQVPTAQRTDITLPEIGFGITGNVAEAAMAARPEESKMSGALDCNETTPPPGGGSRTGQAAGRQ